MKHWLLLLFIPLLLCAEISLHTSEKGSSIDVNAPALTTEPSFAPLLALEPEFPLFLTNENRQFLIDSPARRLSEEKRNVRILQEHSFPWYFLLSLLGIGLAGWGGIILRQHLQNKHVLETQTISLQKEAEQALLRLTKKELHVDLYKNYFLNLSDFCIWYMGKRFQMKISFFSPSELEGVLNQLNKIQPELTSKMKLFLTEAYYVKYAEIQPTLEQCELALQSAKELIRS